MHTKHKKLFSPFASLNLTQFFTALNDNLYKLLLIFFLISLKGSQHSNTILSLAGAVFVIPFLLFASTAGTLADRFSKRTIIYFTRLLEILTTILGVLAFSIKSPLAGYGVLFLMATHSAIFSPCKYGIIPELVSKEKISNCNGMMTATTYFAIIFGTFMASFLTEVTHQNFVAAGIVTVVIACIGALVSLGIKKTKPQDQEKKVSIHFIAGVYQTLKKAKQERYLLTTIIFGAYFLFVGSYTQLNMIPFTLQSLHLSDVQGGYLFLMTAIGIGIGSFLAGRLSGKQVELGFVPLAVFGISLAFILLYIFDAHFFVVVPTLIFVGIFGGFYIVPIDAFIQVASPDKDRGQNVAAANFLSFTGVILASLLLAVLGNGLKMSAAEGFLSVGVLTFLIGCLLLLLYADQVLRLFVSVIFRFFGQLRVRGRKHLKSTTPALLVAQRTSWVDTLIVMATLPRLIRYIVPTQKGNQKKRSLLYKAISMVPIDIEHFSPIGPLALEAIERELKTGHSVCLMHPTDFPAKTLQEWEVKIEQLLKDIQAPIMPIHIARQSNGGGSKWDQFKELTKHPILVSYGSQS